ncbi:MAG: hypothetical protein K1X83_15725 [Oligoflexia bacterium]|nr:hypothetical protein [Oligoflexia bacterium]
MVGILKQHSPGVHKTLERRFSAEELVFLDRLFETALIPGAKQEAGLLRPEGADYNPLPGRILQILLTQLELPSLEFLSAGLLVCLSICELQLLKQDQDPRVRTAAQLAETALNPGNPITEPEAAAAALALELDRIRHLHMRELSADQFETAARRSLTVLARTLATEQNTRLRTLVQATVDRQLRHYE